MRSEACASRSWSWWLIDGRESCPSFVSIMSRGSGQLSIPDLRSMFVASRASECTQVARIVLHGARASHAALHSRPHGMGLVGGFQIGNRM